MVCDPVALAFGRISIVLSVRAVLKIVLCRVIHRQSKNSCVAAVCRFAVLVSRLLISAAACSNGACFVLGIVEERAFPFVICIAVVDEVQARSTDKVQVMQSAMVGGLV